LRFKVFGRHTGLRVSELILGAGAIGTRWGHGADPAAARRLVNGYATEAELFPMAEALGLGIAVYSPLGGGMLTGKYRRGEQGRLQGFDGRVFQPENTPQRTAGLDELEGVARETGATTSQIAIAWVASKGAIPIIGPRTVEQLEDNLGSAGLNLAPEIIARLDKVSAIAPGYPHRLPPGGRAQALDRSGKPIEIDLPANAVA
jgi:aryl-alcohol dehydrogenase-like predicted oxidoreductase